MLFPFLGSAQSLNLSGGGGGSGVVTASDCSSYTALGQLCQDTDDGKLYKGTGGAAVEVAAGAGDMTEATYVSGGVIKSDKMAGATSSAAGVAKLGEVGHLADCNIAAYQALGMLCQDTDDGKLYKGTGSAIEEVAAGDALPAHEPNCVYGYDGDEVFGCYTQLTMSRVEVGSDPAINATTNIGIDSTARQFVYHDGTYENVLSAIQTKEFNRSSVSGAVSTLWWRTPYPIVIHRADCIAEGTTPAVTVDFQACDTTTGDTCATTGITPVVAADSTNTTSPSVTITTASNDVLKMAYDGGSVTSVTIAEGTYTTGASLASAIQAAVNAAFSISSTVTWSITTNRLTVTVPTGHVISYTTTSSTASTVTGFTANISAAESITATAAVIAPQAYTTQWIKVVLSSVSGTIDHLSCTVQYTTTRQ